MFIIIIIIIWFLTLSQVEGRKKEEVSCLWDEDNVIGKIKRPTKS